MKTRKIKILIHSLLASLLIVGATGCEDFLTTNPSVAISDGIVLSDISNLSMVLNGCYRSLYFVGDREYKGQPGYQMYGDLGGADIICLTGTVGGSQVDSYRFVANKTSASGSSVQIWEKMYNIINSINVVIDNALVVSGSESKKNEVLGQALAIRGICYFNLIQNYQQTYAIAKTKPGVILRTSSTQVYGGVRASVEACYALIVDDLTKAKTLLANYTRPDKYYVDQYVVAGLLARVYSVMGNWPLAETEADFAYNKYNQLMTKEQYQGGFADASVPEVMWAVDQTNTLNFGFDSQYSFWYTRLKDDQAYYSYESFFVSDEYVALFANATDYRYLFDKLTGTPSAFAQYYPNHKWKDPGNGNFQSRGSVPLMRGAEMLLIRAEARANQPSKLSLALADLNLLQTTRNATITTNAANPALLEDIYVERRKELLGEGVAGMYDLLRLQKPLERGASHPIEGRFTIASNDYRFICQIPAREFDLNTDLDPVKDQNPASGQ